MPAMDLHPQVAHYVSLMRSKFTWYGADDQTNKTLSRRLSRFYTQIRWILNILVSLIVVVILNRVDSFGLYDGTFVYIPFSLILSILVTLTTFTGMEQEQLTSRFSYFFFVHNEPWMKDIRDRYVIFLNKFIKVFWAYVDIVIILYVMLPLVANIVLHYGFGYLSSPYILPGHFTPLLDEVVKWDYKYYLITVFNIWAIADQIAILESLVASYSTLATFFLIEMEILEIQLKSLNGIDFERQSEIDEQFKLVVESHSEVVRLNEDLKQYFGLLGAIVSAFTSIILTLCSFLIAMASDPIVRLSNSAGFSMFFCWALLCCYLGQRMENKSDDIFRSVYNLRWYELSPEVRKSINMILRQARTPMTIDFHGKFQMNFNNLKQILRNSYSFFTLLQSATTG